MEKPLSSAGPVEAAPPLPQGGGLAPVLHCARRRRWSAILLRRPSVAPGAALRRCRRARSRHQQLPAAGRAARPAAGFASSTRSRASSGSARGWRRPACCPRRRWRARSRRSRSAPARSRYRRVAAARYVATEACRRAANCERVSRPRARARSGSRSRSSRPPRRRGSSSPAARRCSIRASPTRSSSISAAARPRSSGCGSARRRDRRRRRPQILGSISLPFGVVTLTDRFGGRSVAGDLSRDGRRGDGGARAVRAQPRHPAPCRAGRVQMLGSSGTVTTLAGIHLALPRYIRALVDGSSADLRPDRRACRAIWPGSTSPGAPPALRRPRARRSGADRLRHPRRDLRDLAGRPAARRRSRRARGHPVRPDPG